MEAFKFFEEAIKFNDKDIAIRINRGDCLLELKNLDQALEEYTICIKIEPKNKEVRARVSIVYYKHAIICFNNKDYLQCVSNLCQAIQYSSGCCEFYVLRARAYMRIKDITKAYEDITSALRINPVNNEALELKKFFNK